MVRRQPLSPAEKEYLYQRKQAGASHAEVAGELHCARETVRKHWQANRRGKSKGRRGRPACGVLGSYPAEIVEEAIKFKRAHPHWGPANIRLELRSQFGKSLEELPSCSRLSVLFKSRCAEAVQARHKPLEPPEPPPILLQVHQRWQIDAKEKIRLVDGEIASLVEIRDPVAALMIASQAFLTTLTSTTYRKITLAEIQATLRQAFEEWGKPAEIQSDHEDVYAGANQSDFPMPFTLWLVGLGIQHVFSRARCPTDQPHIERNHRTTGDLSWKDQPPANLRDLQQRLDACRLRYNHEFPAQASDCHGLPPLVCHPQARFSGRLYSAPTEWDLFDLALVDRYLAQFHWIRKIDAHGVAFLGNHPYSLGKKFKHQFVSVGFLPEIRAFRFETEAGEWIQSIPAKGLEKSDLTGLIPQPSLSGLALQLALPWVGV